MSAFNPENPHPAAPVAASRSAVQADDLPRVTETTPQQPPALATPTIGPAPWHKPATRYDVLGAISFSHLLNDMMQSLIVAIYPLLKGDFHLSFLQVGLITLTFQLTASLLQPLVGIVTDKRPMPYSLPIGMCFTLSGLVLLAVAPSFGILLIAVALIGSGSSVFHPESSRVARMASGDRFGFAQSVFQIGGNFGASLGPLLAAWVVLRNGRGEIAWFALAALLAIIVLIQVGGWYRRHVAERVKRTARAAGLYYPRKLVVRTIAVLMVLIFSKFFYLASISSYYEFYLIHHFGISVRNAQYLLFVFLAAVAAGTLIGGPLGDRIGRRTVIWVSILGVAPFTLLLPHVDLLWTGVLSVVIGVILASAFPAIIVYAQDMMPRRIGVVSGLFYGLAFGMGGLGAAVLGALADKFSIVFVYQVCAFLPLLGIFAVFLPDIRPPRHAPPSSDAHTQLGRTDPA
ncbi:MAG: MFS transporter [Gammaproteobacteria bacterium]|nr:MFS transporter [Gammaproteobacteria bacterium]